MSPRMRLISMGIPSEMASKVCFCDTCNAMRDGLENMCMAAISLNATAPEIANAFAMVAASTVGQLAQPGDLDGILADYRALMDKIARVAEYRTAQMQAETEVKS